ncbi:MAG: BatA and WFA domain-containing protein [Cytophagales bacterium]|nr:BatA and WFA domain-containing protein [Cytophagales bacterium]
MNFLYPAFLWALLLVAIPIIIHLFNFQRPKVVYFTNVAFLQEVQLVARSRNRVKNWLVLLMRCLFVTALVVAFAQPVIPHRKGSSPPLSAAQTAIYIDNSFSMQYEREGKKLLDRAIDAALQIIKGFPNNTRFAVLNNSFENDFNFLLEPTKASDLISRTDYSNTARTLENVYQRQESLLTNNASGGHYVFWISDFQQFPGNDLEKLATSLDTINQFFLLLQQADEVSNVFIDSVWLENPFVRVNESNTLYVRLRHFGNEITGERLVKLFIDNKQVSGGTINLQPGESGQMALNFAVTSAGQKHCRVVVEDLPVTFDNAYYFTLSVAPDIRILHIAENQQATSYIVGVYSNEPFFKLESVNVGALDYARIGLADVVILQGLKEIDPGLQTALRNFLAKGGALAIFPAQFFNPQDYSNLLGIRINFINEALSSATMPLPMNPPDLQEPFFKGVFEKVSEQMATPEAKANLSWAGAGRNLLTLRNGQPYLTSFEVLNSTVFLFAAPLDLSFTNLPQNAFFVPIMYKIALAGKRSTGRLAYSFAESLISIPLTEGQNFSRNDVLKLVPVDTTTSKAKELIPMQRFADNQLILELPKTELPAGNYNLVQRKNGSVVAALALNYDKTESQLKTYTAEEIRKIFAGKKNVQVIEEAEAREFASTFDLIHLNRPLWRYFIIAALLFLLAEILLLRFWKS